MKAFLMHPDRDFDLQPDLSSGERRSRSSERGPGEGRTGRPSQLRMPPNEIDLVEDLELNTLLRAMADNDPFLFNVARQGIHSGLASPAEIVYRQHVLADCIAQPAVIRELYDVAVAAITGEKKIFGWMHRDSPETILHRSRQLLHLYVAMLRRLKEITDENAARFRSGGFTRFFTMLASELDDDYFAEMEGHLSELAFRRGTLISIGLGKGTKGTDYVLRRHQDQSWRDRIPGMNRSGFTFTIPERDDNGFRALSDLNGRGLSETANSLAQAADHVRSFFQMLRAELGFYISCLNLRERLTAKGEPTSFPVPAAPASASTAPASTAPASTGQAALSARGLYDACLALTIDTRVTGNDLDANGKQLIMITGANQGGKSTFLRSLGLAQLMMQAGMFVAAESFTGSVTAGVFTHYKREEDATMEKGKLDEELNRMSDIAGLITSGGLLLCNESFASTNEREGSEIARQIIRALTEAGIRVVFVTHLYDLAERCFTQNTGEALFLRAERRADGRRTFRLLEGEPLPTSYGQDLYRQIFGKYEPARA